MADDILKFRAGPLHQRVLEQAAERDVTISQFLREAVEAYTGCDHCGTCEICGLEQINPDEYATEEPKPVASIWGTGLFSETDNTEVLALIDRARELLAEGAVGVSVALDMNPDDLPDGISEEDLWDPDDATIEALENARLRIRHVAIVDTPAFSGAYLALNSDGTLSGPVVFEGINTGDLRSIKLEQIMLDDESLLPVPIIFDLHEGDHTGVTVGHIDRLERITGETSDVVPIAASMGAYPAYLFAEPEPTAMTVHAPDKNGYRRYTGIIAPTGVCHKGMGGCYTYRGADLDYFHSGARVPLDDGTMIRVGPLVMGGVHADSSVKPDGSYKPYVAARSEVEDARTVFAMGRMFHHPQGLLFSGVLMPDADIMRIQATAPSVELWPNNRGKMELKTALQVPRPGFPVAASAGAGIQLTESEPVVVELEAVLEGIDLARIDALEAVVGELYAAHLAQTLD